MNADVRMKLCLFFLLILISAAVPGADAGTLIFKNENPTAVAQGPSTQGPSFTITRVHVIDGIYTYHWNGGNGVPSGQIWLTNSTGQKYGPWNASPVSKVYLFTNPNMTLPPGTYTVGDSNPATWSFNAGSGSRGFVQVYGNPVELNSLATIDDVKGRVSPLSLYDRQKAIDTLSEDKKGPVQVAFGLRPGPTVSIDKSVLSVSRAEKTLIRLSNPIPNRQYWAVTDLNGSPMGFGFTNNTTVVDAKYLSYWVKSTRTLTFIIRDQTTAYSNQWLSNPEIGRVNVAITVP